MINRIVEAARIDGMKLLLCVQVTGAAVRNDEELIGFQLTDGVDMAGSLQVQDSGLFKSAGGDIVQIDRTQIGPCQKASFSVKPAAAEYLIGKKAYGALDLSLPEQKQAAILCDSGHISFAVGTKLGGSADLRQRSASFEPSAQ